MPEYDHKCTECGHRFSVRRSIREADREEKCPSCGGRALRAWTAPLLSRLTCGSGPSSSSFG